VYRSCYTGTVSYGVASTPSGPGRTLMESFKEYHPRIQGQFDQSQQSAPSTCTYACPSCPQAPELTLATQACKQCDHSCQPAAKWHTLSSSTGPSTSTILVKGKACILSRLQPGRTHQARGKSLAHSKQLALSCDRALQCSTLVLARHAIRRTSLTRARASHSRCVGTHCSCVGLSW